MPASPIQNRINPVRAHTLAVLAGLLCIVAPAAHAGKRVIATTAGVDIDVPVGGAADSVMFSGVTDPVTGFAVTARFVSPVADTGGGAYPWSVDFGITATAPGGASATSPEPWFGDVSFAAFPVADGFGGYAGVDGNGAWSLAFDSGVIAPFVAGLRDVSYHLLADAADIESAYTENTQQGNSWNRPFFITGISGLGPVDYHVLEFTVETSGLYDFASVLASGNDHWTCLYIDSFNDAQPLGNLHEYGLGNGFSQFDVPRGESRFTQLLLEDTTYYWVTSQWSSFAAFSDFDNTITGPGQIFVAGQGCNLADNAEPFGVLDLGDVQGFIGAFTSQDPSADVAAPFGVLDLADLQAFIGAFLDGCP